MNLSEFKEIISTGKLVCPECGKPILEFEKFLGESIANIWDGAGDSKVETAGSKVTLICANEGCQWRERTEYWSNYLK